MFPAWKWVNQPHHRFLSASYGIDLTTLDNLTLRRLVSSEWYQSSFGIGIAEDDGGKTGFSNTAGGSIRAVSIGTGKTTGYGADTFIIDDPINVADANQDSARTDAINWFKESAQSRLNSVKNGAIVLIMQRVHEEDVAAVAMEMGYEKLIIPMSWDEQFRHTTSIGWTDPRTKDGELMWPERFPQWYIDQQRENIGEYAYSAQYQQTPVPRKGGLIQVDNIRVIDELPDENFIAVRAWDLAGSEGKGAYTVGTRLLWGETSQQFYVADIQRKQLGGGGVRDLIQRMAEEDGITTKIVIPRDPGQAGKAQSEDIAAQLRGYSVKIEAQSGSKELRAEPFASQVEIGKVNVLNRTWTKAWLDELRFFPKGRLKDQVDATASAFNELAAMTRRGRKTPQLSLVGAKQDNVFKVA
jgi:predicted phage terminase large subunit-like protein